MRTNLTALQALMVLAKTEMKPFDKNDWSAFAGCESAEPMIGSHLEYCVVVDGAQLLIIHQDDDHGGQLFELKGNA